MSLDRGQMRACYRCGEPGSAVEVTHEDKIVALGALCDHCFARAVEEAAELRIQFEALLAAGASREEANARMIEKIEGRGGRA